MSKILLTGATGYVGGEALHKIASSTSKHQISCVVRDSSKAKVVKEAFPHVRIIECDLDDVETIEQEARDADVVLHLASTNHIASAKAIARALSDESRAQPGYWIQMSGATMVCAEEIAHGTFGEASGKQYDDVVDLEVIHSLITSNPARAVDNLVISQDQSTIKTALIFGPLIYGQGHGPVNERSIQAPEIARSTLVRRHGFRLGAGKNTWSNVHIHDLGDLFVAFLEAAVTGMDGLWNDQGIFFPENGSMTFGDLCGSITKECVAQGLLETTEQDVISAPEADSMSGHASIMWGTNAVLKGSRARELLGWSPSGGDLTSELPETIRREAASL